MSSMLHLQTSVSYLLLSFHFIILLFVFHSSGFRSVKMNYIFVSRFQPSKKHTYIIIFMSFYQLEKCCTSTYTQTRGNSWRPVFFFPKKKNRLSGTWNTNDRRNTMQCCNGYPCGCQKCLLLICPTYIILFLLRFRLDFNSCRVQNE